MSHKTKVLNHYRPVTFRADKRECILNLYHVSKSINERCASHELKSVQTYISHLQSRVVLDGIY